MVEVTTVSSIAELKELQGKELGPTEWYTVDQDKVNAFADATEDHQWIHVDVERAKASPLGGTIVHGLFTLSLGPYFSEQLIQLEGFTHTLNYGYNKVRFPHPLPVGTRIRVTSTISSVEEVREGSAQVTTVQVYEAEGIEKPVCVAEALGRYTE
ncbi:MaoC family dehydratase [Auritidibacter ignavus]|uniref:MaoC family dehydratase n=1 Tax=Auritidibacter ignavus TaxID=678932 RepID=UPI002FE6B415